MIDRVSAPEGCLKAENGAMTRRGHTGTSMGGRIVSRKDLKPKKQPPPVDPATLSPAAQARREAYHRDQEEREAAVTSRTADARAAKEAERRHEKQKGKTVISAADAVKGRLT